MCSLCFLISAELRCQHLGRGLMMGTWVRLDGWMEFRGSSSRSRSINIRSPSDQGVAPSCLRVCVSFGVVMCELVLVTQRLTHQSAFGF